MSHEYDTVRLKTDEISITRKLEVLFEYFIQDKSKMSLPLTPFLVNSLNELQ